MPMSQVVFLKVMWRTFRDFLCYMDGWKNACRRIAEKWVVSCENLRTKTLDGPILQAAQVGIFIAFLGSGEGVL